MQDASFQFDVMPNCDPVAQSVAEFLKCDACLVCVATEFEFALAGRSGAGAAHTTGFALDDTLCTRTLHSNAVLRWPDVSQVTGLSDTGAVQTLDIKAYMGVPLRRSTGEVVGFVSAVHNAPRLWRSSDTHYLTTIAELLQARIECHLLQAEQDALSMALAENDGVLAALARVGGTSLTVQSANDTLLFVNQAVERELGLRDADVLALPALVRSVVGQGQATADLVVDLPERGATALRVRIIRCADGLLVADWTLGDAP
ncbi:MAG: GAF domain-containing protein [Pseudomonadota bacterium]